MNFKWAWCLLALRGAALRSVGNDEVGFSISYSISSSNLEINGKATGCTIQKQTVLLTCREPDFNSEPSNAFSSVVDCQNMAPEFKAVTIQPSPLCAKVSVTLQSSKGRVDMNTLRLEKGQMANFTCVLWPVKPDNKGKSSKEGPELVTSVMMNVTATNAQNVEETQAVEIGSVAFQVATKPEMIVTTVVQTDVVSRYACRAGLKAAFGWKLTLTNSSHNVHELLWTSEPKPRDKVQPVIDVNLGMKISRCLMDVAFEDLSPEIGITSKGPRDAVQLQMSQAPWDYEDPTKHQEVVKLVVDATKIDPRGYVKEVPLEVSIEYTLPTIGKQIDFFVLPLEKPTVPDSDPDAPKAGSGGRLVLGLILAALILVVGFGGAFLYRRNQMIRAQGG